MMRLLIGTDVAEASRDKKGRRVVIGSGSSAGVAKRFGGGALHLSDGGSFGGTELPKQSKEQKGEAADKAT